jgi:hypothetical protein
MAVGNADRNPERVSFDLAVVFGPSVDCNTPSSESARAVTVRPGPLPKGCQREVSFAGSCRGVPLTFAVWRVLFDLACQFRHLVPSPMASGIIEGQKIPAGFFRVSGLVEV